MESPDDLSTEQWSQALDQAWGSGRTTNTGGTDLLSRMRDSIAAIDTSSEQPKITKEEFLAEMARSRA